jgi:plasmid stabilization system protein ParE
LISPRRAWYEEQEPGAGLAEALDIEVEWAILNLRTDALLSSIRFRDVRRASLKRFAQIGVYYVVRGQDVTVIAVFHDARDPHLLRERRDEVIRELRPE